MLIHNLGAAVSETLVLTLRVALLLGAPTKRTLEMGDVLFGVVYSRRSA